MTREAHYWTADKLDFLDKYMPAFVDATKKAYSRHYVDGFAGPGVNRIRGIGERLGSPLIALNVPQPFTDYHFVEIDKQAFAKLYTHVQAHRRKGRVKTLLNGDFNSHIVDIIEKLHPRAPTLFFLDPEGLELEFETLRHISRREKADVFILISGSGVIRNLDNSSAFTRITRFYGDEKWKEIYELYSRGELRATFLKKFEVFTDLYIENLKHLGFDAAGHYLIARNRRNVPLHALIFAVKSDKPKAAMSIAEDILKKLKSGTQISLF